MNRSGLRGCPEHHPTDIPHSQTHSRLRYVYQNALAHSPLPHDCLGELFSLLPLLPPPPVLPLLHDDPGDRSTFGRAPTPAAETIGAAFVPEAPRLILVGPAVAFPLGAMRRLRSPPAANDERVLPPPLVPSGSEPRPSPRPNDGTFIPISE